MQSYTWPGNVRELRNTVERIVIMSPESSGGSEGSAGVGDKRSGILLSFLHSKKPAILSSRIHSTQIGRAGGNVSRAAS